MTTVAPLDALNDGALPPCMAAIKTLLDRDETVVEDRWKSLSDAELSGEITAYREGVLAISKELEARGVAVSLDAEESRKDPQAKGRIPGVEVSSSLAVDSLASHRQLSHFFILKPNL